MESFAYNVKPLRDSGVDSRLIPAPRGRETGGSADRGHLARIFAQGVTSLQSAPTAHLGTYFENNHLRATLGPKGLAAGLRAFFASHFYACVVSACRHAAYFENNLLQSALRVQRLSPGFGGLLRAAFSFVRGLRERT
jgi:hypothetical protein